MRQFDDDLRPEYDLSELLKRGVRGKYAQRYRNGTNLVKLAPDAARASIDDDLAEAPCHSDADTPES